MDRPISGKPLERRLAAIVAADVVGYSRMMGEGEVGTFQALRTHQRELIGPAVAKYHGHIFKTTGDGMLVEFHSIVDAVACAVTIQRAMLDRNAGLPEEKRIVFRVGINLGDVIIDGDDVFGDGVNVAARLEAICEPGGVTIARNVHDQLRAKLPVVFENIGERALKNIPVPVGVFGLSAAELAKLPLEALPAAAGPPAGADAVAMLDAPAPAQRRVSVGWRLAAALVVIIVLAGGLGILIDRASKSRSIVIDLFDTPPALAAAGLTGKIVAGDIHDELIRMETTAAARKRNAPPRAPGPAKPDWKPAQPSCRRPESTAC